jgi:methionyl-tRNA formyltransferase
MKLQPTPVKTAAEALGLPVFQPTTLKESSFRPSWTSGAFGFYLVVA